jgi:hypothetical protein
MQVQLFNYAVSDERFAHNYGLLALLLQAASLGLVISALCKLPTWRTNIEHNSALGWKDMCGVSPVEREHSSEYQRTCSQEYLTSVARPFFNSRKLSVFERWWARCQRDGQSRERNILNLNLKIRKKEDAIFLCSINLRIYCLKEEPS